jgi:hypothetical protein
MCQDCFATLDIPPATIDRKDLLHEADVIDVEELLDIDYSDLDDLADYVDLNRTYDTY